LDWWGHPHGLIPQGRKLTTLSENLTTDVTLTSILSQDEGEEYVKGIPDHAAAFWGSLRC
jgi:hypothetical protein